MRASLLRPVILVSLFVGVASIGTARAQSRADQEIREELQRLRQELESLRQQYAERFSELATRLAALEGAQAAPPSAEPSPTTSPPIVPVAPVPPGATGSGEPQNSLPIYGNANVLSKIFNPDLAAIGNFLGAAGKNPRESLPALDMREIETSVQAVVDPYARADFFFASSPEGVQVEEAYITLPTLPAGLLMKAGKLRGAFGKVNTMHTHMLPWADRPLLTRNLLGGDEGISDAGISVARLLPVPWIFLEATGEVYRGDSELFSSYQRQDLAYLGHVRGYRDISESSNLEFGASLAYGHNDAGPSATTRLVGLDGTFRYRPPRRAMYQRILARTELGWSRRSELGGSNAFGAYLAADYQLARQWFAGARFDYAERATAPDSRDKGTSWLLTYWPSEFSQIRTQFRRTNYAEGQTANEFLFEFVFSIGVHGAHAF